MGYSELAWLLLEQRRPVDEVCKRTGFPRVLVERMAVDMEKQQAIKQAERAVRKAERQVELAAIRMERGCPMCNTGYANVVATCFPPYSNVREFTDRPVDFFMHATCLNRKCPMQTLQPMPDEHTAIEYFKNGWSWKPATGYARLTPLGQEYVFKDLMKRGYTAGELKQLGFKPDMVDRQFMIRDLDRMVYEGVDTELMCPNCGRKCWKSSEADKLKKEQGVQWLCTRCALEAGLVSPFRQNNTPHPEGNRAQRRRAKREKRK